MKNCMQARFCIGLSIFLLLASGWAVSLFSQRNAKKSKNEDTPTYKKTVNVVLVNASVFDKKGNPVKDLTAEDFRIYDEGEPQKIQTFAVESYDPDSEEEQHEQQPDKKALIIEQSSKTRLISFFIDDYTTAMSKISYYPDMINAIKKFVETDLKPNDQLAILSASKLVNYPFLNDKRQITDELAVALQKLESSVAPHSPSDYWKWNIAMNINGGLPYYRFLHDHLQIDLNGNPIKELDGKTVLRCQGKECADEEKQINQAVIDNANAQYATHQFLAMLNRHIRTLQHFEGQKCIIVFSEGFLSEPQSETKYKVQETIDLAIRDGIILNFINPLGVSDRDQIHQGTEIEFLDKRARYSTMEQITSSTGGIFDDDNNIINIINKIARRPLYRYAMSYVMPPHKTPGVHQKIKLEVNRPGLTLSYKKGYYFSKEELTFQSNKKEDVLEAVNALGDLREIPVNLAYNYSLADDDLTYAVDFLTSVYVKKIKFIEEEERRKNLLHLVLAVFDEAGNYVNGLEKTIDFQLLETSYPAFLSRGIESKVEFKLHPGRYIVKSIVREDNQGKLGSTSKTIDIP